MGSSFSNRILSVAVIGVASSIPTTPHNMPHTIKVNRITSGCRSSASPINRGSTTLPMANWMTPGTAIARTALRGEISGLTTTTGSGSSVAITEPTPGMKFSRNASTPNTNANSTPSRARLAPTRAPVASEMAALVTT